MNRKQRIGLAWILQFIFLIQLKQYQVFDGEIWFYIVGVIIGITLLTWGKE